MYDALFEMIAEVGTIGVRAVGAVVAAVAGVLVEMNGIQTLGTGDQVIGVWMAFVGCLLLVVCYVLAGEVLQFFRQPAA